MGVKKKINRTLAIFLVLSMAVSSIVYAEEIAVTEDSIIVNEEPEDAESRINSMLNEADSLIYDTDFGLTGSEVITILAKQLMRFLL